jgi:DNA-binding NarL/FixJ family response regulator
MRLKPDARKKPVSSPARRAQADRAAAAAKSARARHRLLLVDAQPIFRLGLRALLGSEVDLAIVGDADSSDGVLEMLASVPVDVIVTDLALHGKTGLELLDVLRVRHPAVPVLVLTDCGGYEYARASFAAGAAGFALKSGSHAELLHAIRTVAGGGRYVNGEIASRIVGDYLGNASAGRSALKPPIISKRERDVLTRVAAGHGNREIAEQLGLSIWTVRKHRQNLMQKFSLHNSAAITAFAINNGLVPVSPNHDPRRS